MCYRWCRRSSLAVRFAGSNSDTVGLRVVTDVEVDSLSHVPQLDVVVAVDGVRLEVELSSVHVEGLRTANRGQVF